MSNVIKLKRSAVQGKVPLTSDLDLGEIGINTNSGKLYLKRDNGSQSIIDVGGNASNVDITTIGSPSLIKSTQDSINASWSAGVITPNLIQNNMDGTINILSGEAMLRPSASELAPLISMSFNGVNNFTLFDNSVNYIYLDYNNGSPIFVKSQDINSFNCLDKCILCTITREGTVLNIVDASTQNVDANRKYRRLLLETQPFRRLQSGGILSATGMTLQVTQGGFYYGLNKISYNAFNTGIVGTNNENIFTYYHKDINGTWVRTPNSKLIDNVNYNSTTGLSPVGNNKFKVDWVYLINNGPTNLAVIYGNTTYNNLATALLATAPASAPASIASIGMLLGRCIVEYNSSVMSQVDNIITSGFQNSSVSNHNDLANIQGGVIGEYYHLTNLQSSGLTGGLATTLHTHDFSTLTTKPTTLSGYGITNAVSTSTSQLANTFLSAPNGVAGNPSFRTIVANDIPTLNQNTTGNATTASTATIANGLNVSNSYTGVSFNGITGVSITAPLVDGVATIGTSTTVAKADHIHPTDTTRAQDSLVLHLSGTETITGAKTFSTQPIGITKTSVGLGNVDNTADVNKPIATTLVNGIMSSSDKTKLDGIATGATANIGTVTNVSALTIGTTGTDVSSTVVNSTSTPVITLQLPSSSATNRGLLTNTDWSAFNNKAGTSNPTFTTNVTSPIFTSTQVTGTAPLSISSTTLVSNLNADMLDGLHVATTATANTVVARDASGNITANVLNGTDLVLSGNLTVNGTTTTINATTISVDDINIELGSVATPTDITANGGGITLKGTTDKTITWGATNGWTSNESLNVVTGKTYKLNGVDVLTSNAICSAVRVVPNG